MSTGKTDEIMSSKKIFLVAMKYSSSIAAINRLMAFAKGLGEDNIDVQVLFLLPDAAYSRVEGSYPNVSFHYLWEGQQVQCNNLKKKIIFFKSIRKMFHCFERNSNVLLLTFFWPLFILLSFSRKIALYHETTEIPTITFPKSFIGKRMLHYYIKRCRTSRGIFVISDHIKQYYISEGIPESKIHIVNMIVDPDRFSGLQPSPTQDKYIAYCGTVSNAKDGVDYLIKSFRIVANKYPEYKLYIIGNTPLAIDLQTNSSLVRSLNLTDKVIFTGRVESKEMPHLLFNARILALARPTSLQAECGFPTKLGEYLCTENPVVITDTGEIKNYLTDGVSCIFAKPNDEQDFALKLQWVIENYDKALTIAQKGRLVALCSFNYRTQSMIIRKVICG